MASRNSHIGDSRAGTSWSTEAKAPYGSERRNSQSQHRRYSLDAQLGSTNKHRYNGTTHRHDETPRNHHPHRTHRNWESRSRNHYRRSDNPHRDHRGRNRDAGREQDLRRRSDGGGGISKLSRNPNVTPTEERKSMYERLLAKTTDAKYAEVHNREVEKKAVKTEERVQFGPVPPPPPRPKMEDQVAREVKMEHQVREVKMEHHVMEVKMEDQVTREKVHIVLPLTPAPQPLAIPAWLQPEIGGARPDDGPEVMPIPLPPPPTSLFLRPPPPLPFPPRTPATTGWNTWRTDGPTVKTLLTPPPPPEMLPVWEPLAHQDDGANEKTPSPPPPPPPPPPATPASRDPRLLKRASNEQQQPQPPLELQRPPFCNTTKEVASENGASMKSPYARPSSRGGVASDPRASPWTGVSPPMTPRPAMTPRGEVTTPRPPMTPREVAGSTPRALLHGSGKEKARSNIPFARPPLASREAAAFIKGADGGGSNKENNHHNSRKRPTSSTGHTPPVKHAKTPAAGQQPQHPPDFTDGDTLRLYKVVYDREVHTNEPKTKDFVRRFNGKCGDRYKKFDYPDLPKDPRRSFRRVDQAKDLPLPNLIVDDQYVGIPPRREVTISNLNDNVSRDFLLKMARGQKLEPEEVIVFFHPATKKHLKMALILFHKSADARVFVASNNKTKVMGDDIGCISDPFAAELSSMYGNATGGAPLPALPHLSGMSDHELSLRREKIICNRVGAPKTPPLEAPPHPVPAAAAASVPSNIQREHDNRSLSPMDTSNSPAYEALIPPPPFEPPHLLPPHAAYHDDAGASTSKMASPPPPYSELPPRDHGVYEEIRPESRKRSTEPEAKARSSKRRRPSTSSSSSESSPGEGHGSRHRSEGGVKKKREEYLKVKRYISSERDSNGDKHIVKEVKTVTYKRRTEQRTTVGGKKDPSPDSFDEEMKRREREMNRSATRGTGKDEMRWSTPSSDSDAGREGAGRRKRGKDRATTESSQEEKRPQGAADTASASSSLSAPSLAPPSSTPCSSRRSGFSSAPVFDPTQPPPVIVPPVGLLVLPTDCSQPPPPMPMMIPPPPLPGGFIPPPEFFGLQPTPALMCAASAAGLALPAMGLLPPPPMPPSMCGYGTTPRPTFTSPVKMPHAPQSVDSAAAAGAAASRSLPSVFSSPPLTTSSGGRTPMATTMAAAAGRTPAEMRVSTPTYSEGGSTPRPSAATAAGAAAATGTAEKKGNLDDRLSQLFGLKKAKKEETASEMKHAASAPSMSYTAAAEQRKRDDDDMDIDDDDDDMDVASSSSEGAKPMETVEKRGEMREKGESEEEKRHREREERRKQEEQVEQLTKVTLDKLMRDLEQQITRDLQRKLELTAYQTLEMWQKRQLVDEEEKKKQLIREMMIAASVAAPKTDPMEEMLAAKLKSPQGLQGGISKVFSNISIVKKKILAPAFSRDGTPASRDSRAQSRSKSRSASRSQSTSTSSDETERRQRSSTSSSSESDEDEREEGSRARRQKRRPNKRNIESSQEESQGGSTSESSDDEYEREKENLRKRESSMADDMDLDVVGMSDNEAEEMKKDGMEMKEEPVSASSPMDLGQATVAAATAGATDDKVPLGMQVATAALQRPPIAKYQARHAVNASAAVRTGKVPMPPALAAAAAAPAAMAVQPRPPIKTKADVQRKSEAEKVPNELKGLLPAPESRKSMKQTAVAKKERRVYSQRTEEEEERIRDSFKAGMDGEDEQFLKAMLEEMQKDGARPFGIQKEIEFESRIRAFTPLELKTPAKLGKLDLYFDDPDLAGIVPHPAGCARAQGFYRLTFKQKIRIMRRPEAYQDRTEINERDEVVTRHQVQAQKEQRSMNRRLQTMMDSNPNSEYFKVNQLKYRKKMIKFARSRIHGWGLYALEPIAPDDMIVEYIGQKIRPAVADEREKQYERRGIGSSYLFRIDEDEVIDATRQGNFARFINHSCQPNCYAKVVTVDGDKRIVIYSKSLIQKGDEITYDYKFPIEEDKIDCLCGAPLCRGTLN